MVGKKSSEARLRKLNSSLDRYYFLFIIIIGVIVRLFTINSREIAYDDAFSYFLSLKDFRTIISGTIADTMPPLYYFLLHLFVSISSHLWFIRLANVVLNLCAITFLYLIIKKLFGKNEALFAAFFACISPFQIYHSQEMRMYSLLLIGQAGYLYALINIVSTKSNSNYKLWLMAIFWGSVAMYSHNLALIGIITPNILLLTKKNIKKIYQFLGIQLVIISLFIPWAIYLPQQIAKVQNAFWTPKPGLIEVIQSILLMYGFAPMSYVWMIIVIVLIFQIFILFLIWLVKTKDFQISSLLLISISNPLLLFLISYLYQPVYVPRIFIISGLISFGCLGVYISRNWNKGIGKLVFILALVVSLISLPSYYSFKEFPRSDFSSVSSFLTNETENKALILHDNKLSYFPVEFYAPDLNQIYLADEPGSENDTLAIESQKALGYMAVEDIRNINFSDQLYYVDFEKVESEYQKLGIENPKMVFLNSFYGQPLQKKIFGDLNIYIYEKSHE